MRKLLLTLLIASSLSVSKTHTIYIPDLSVLPHVVACIGSFCIIGSITKMLCGTPTKTSLERNVCALGLILIATAYLAHTTK